MKTNSSPPGKPVSASAIERYPYIVFPADLNGHSQMFGGQLFSLMDRLAGTVFHLHSRIQGATAAFDHGEFTSPVAQGDMLIFCCAINRVWNTSCEIGVKVFLLDQTAEKDSLIPVTRCYFVCVSQEFDPQGKRKPIPPVIPETDEQKRRFKEAGRRRASRLLRKRNNVSKFPA